MLKALLTLRTSWDLLPDYFVTLALKLCLTLITFVEGDVLRLALFAFQRVDQLVEERSLVQNQSGLHIDLLIVDAATDVLSCC